MAVSDNPFSLLFGKKPSQYIDRLSQSDTITATFESDQPSTQVYLITGVRGSGKTVMMTSIANKLNEKKDWIVVNLNPSGDMLQALAAKLYKEPVFKPLLAELKVDFSLLGIGVSIARSNKISDIESVIEILLGLSKKLNKKILVTVDEVTNDENVKEFISAFQILIREDLPIFMMMTGLYENIQQLKNNKSLTFLYRAPKIELAPLNINAIKVSYKNVFSCSDETAEWLAMQTKGYSFAFQVLGFLCWDQKDGDYKKVIPGYVQYLEEYSYEKIWSELSDTEQKILTAISETDSDTVKDIRDTIGFESDKFTVYRTRLIKKGVIYSPSYGRIALALPYFKEFVLSKRFYE